MTMVLFGANPLQYLFGSLIFLTSLFLILLVLVQRGRGGGLTGALGGMGGQSAFGSKAGDTFTRVTMVTATIWILLCIGAILTLSSDRGWGVSSGGPDVTSPGGSAGDDSTGGAETTGDTDTTGDTGGSEGAGEDQVGGTGALDASPSSGGGEGTATPAGGESPAAPAGGQPSE